MPGGGGELAESLELQHRSRCQHSAYMPSPCCTRCYPAAQQESAARAPHTKQASSSHVPQHIILRRVSRGQLSRQADLLEELLPPPLLELLLLEDDEDEVTPASSPQACSSSAMAPRSGRRSRSTLSLHSTEHQLSVWSLPLKRLANCSCMHCTSQLHCHCCQLHVPCSR